MIDALIAGKLREKPIGRTSKAGKTYVTAKLLVAGGDGENVFVSAIAFTNTVCAALLALDDGDSVALAGSLTPKVWTPQGGEPKPALDLVAHQVLTAYHVTRKRQAVAKEPAALQDDGAAPRSQHQEYHGSDSAPRAPVEAVSRSGGFADMRDDLPF